MSLPTDGRSEKPPIQVGILGLNSTGRQLALAFAVVGPVLGFPIPSNSDETAPLEDSGSPEWGAGVEVARDLHRLDEPETLLVCVPVFLTPARGVDLTALAGVATAIARRLRPGQLVVLLGDLPPGTTRSVVLPVLAERGLTPGQDFFLACGADAGEPGGVARWVIGGVDPASRDRASALFERVGLSATRVSSLESAELCGLLRPVYGVVRAALANELRLICDRLGADVWEVLEAAGLADLVAGTGGREPAAALLVWSCRRHRAATRLVELADDRNAEVPAFVVSQLENALNQAGKPVNGSRVLILAGGDGRVRRAPREEPGRTITELLLAKGAVVVYHDPHGSQMPPIVDRHRPQTSRSPLTAELLAEQDAILVIDSDAAYDWDWILSHAPLVIAVGKLTRRPAGGSTMPAQT